MNPQRSTLLYRLAHEQFINWLNPAASAWWGKGIRRAHIIIADNAARQLLQAIDPADRERGPRQYWDRVGPVCPRYNATWLEAGTLNAAVRSGVLLVKEKDDQGQGLFRATIAYGATGITLVLGMAMAEIPYDEDGMILEDQVRIYSPRDRAPGPASDQWKWATLSTLGLFLSILTTLERVTVT